MQQMALPTAVHPPDKYAKS